MNNAIVSTESKYAIIDPARAAEAMEIVNENLGDAGIKLSDLEAIKMPAAGSTDFILDTMDGKIVTAVLTGIIIVAPQQNALWDKTFEQDPNASPICFSPDSKTGRGQRPCDDVTGEHDCATCEYKEWGSDIKGRGKACKDQRPIYLLQEEDYLPVVIKTPLMSLSPLQKYLTTLTRRGLSYTQVITEIGVAPGVSNNNVPAFNVLTFRPTGTIGAEAKAKIKMYQNMLLAKVAQQTVPETAEPAAPEYDPFAAEDGEQSGTDSDSLGSEIS